MGTRTENETAGPAGTDGTPAIGEVEEVREAEEGRETGRDARTGSAAESGESAENAENAENGENGENGEGGGGGGDGPAAAQAGSGTGTGAGAGTGVGLGAAAVVSAALGVVSLTGSWVGTVAQARDSLYGQLETAQGAPVATQIKQVYADSWNTNALVAGLFALTALIVGVVVLVRPAFGDPERIPAQAPWIKSVAWAGVVLGVVGLLLAALKYTDVLLGMPSTG